MLDNPSEFAIRVTDLKQWAYCPRVFYYQHCMPRVRPETFLMREGVEAGRAEEGREERRSLKPYGLTSGERAFNVPVYSAEIGLRGQIDMLIRAGRELIPVDYKLSETAGPHFKLQVAAYAMLLEAMHGVAVTRGFLYLIPLRRAEEVRIDARLRNRLENALIGMRQVVYEERMPAPVKEIGKCVSCEFRRFCNDVL